MSNTNNSYWTKENQKKFNSFWAKIPNRPNRPKTEEKRQAYLKMQKNTAKGRKERFPNLAKTNGGSRKTHKRSRKLHRKTRKHSK